MLTGSSEYAYAAPSRPHFGALFSTMATLSAFVSESRRQEARQNAAACDDDDYCYPIYKPRIQTIPREALLVQLCSEASRLRCQLAAVDAQICQLAAVGPLPWPSHSTPLTAAPPGLGISVALAAVARRKVMNKKVILESEKPAAKCVPFGKDGFVKHDPANDLGRRLIDQRADAYEHGEGPNDSGSTSSEDDDVCTVCGEERALVTCPSGCGGFCQLCYEAHVEDGRHWTP